MVAIGTKGVQWMQLVKIGKKKKSIMQFIIYFTVVVICTPENWKTFFKRFEAKGKPFTEYFCCQKW